MRQSLGAKADFSMSAIEDRIPQAKTSPNYDYQFPTSAGAKLLKVLCPLPRRERFSGFIEAPKRGCSSGFRFE
jgi:hypothetical protein